MGGIVCLLTRVGETTGRGLAPGLCRAIQIEFKSQKDNETPAQHKCVLVSRFPGLRVR